MTVWPATLKIDGEVIESAEFCGTTILPFIGDDGINWDKEALRAAKEDCEFTDTKYFDYFIRFIRPGAMRVLDIGCNIGKWYPIFNNIGCVYEGLDASPTAIEIARKRHPNVTFYLMKAEHMTFIKKYDLIFTHTVLQHMKLKTKKLLMPRIHRALVNHGLLIIEEKSDEFTPTSFTRDGWVKFIKSYRFDFINGTAPDDPRNGYIFRKKSL